MARTAGRTTSIAARDAADIHVPGSRPAIGAWRIDGDTATSTSSYWVVQAQDGTASVATGGYADQLRKRDGVWKLQRRVQTIDPSLRT